MSKTEINDYLSKCDEDLANNVIYRVYGMPGPIFMEKNNDTPTPEPPTPGPVYSIPFYVENITQEDETLTIAGYDWAETGSYLKIPVEYSIDCINWSSLGTTGETPLTLTLQPSDKVYLRATTNAWYEHQDDPYIDRGCTIFGVSKVGGNIMSLLYGSNFTGKETAFPSESMCNFCALFNDIVNEDNTILVSAPELILPATTLAEGCYANMFHGCTSLTTPPSLPTATLAENCYGGMFQDCTSLTSAPELPATTLANSCYGDMFRDCISLTSAPSLPATTLSENCYGGMFAGCTALTTPPSLPATTLSERCYDSMFIGCTSLTSASTLPATTLAEGCYNCMFMSCTSLTWEDVPELPATTLANSCYDYMFGSISNMAFQGDAAYNEWCANNIPSSANYDRNTHGILFDINSGSIN